VRHHATRQTQPLELPLLSPLIITVSCLGCPSGDHGVISQSRVRVVVSHRPPPCTRRRAARVVGDAPLDRRYSRGAVREVSGAPLLAPRRRRHPPRRLSHWAAAGAWPDERSEILLEQRERADTDSGAHRIRVAPTGSNSTTPKRRRTRVRQIPGAPLRRLSSERSLRDARSQFPHLA
jgi:hypothetical protein